MFCVYFVLSENKLSASTAEMFEVVGRFLKCFGLLSQVGWFICDKHTTVDVFFFEYIAKSDNPNNNFIGDQTKQYFLLHWTHSLWVIQSPKVILALSDCGAGSSGNIIDRLRTWIVDIFLYVEANPV